MLAAELDFQLNNRVPVYVLDNPLNVIHGRAPQLAIWQRNESALHAAHAGAPMLLAVGETALRERDRPGWLGSVCARIDQPQPLQRLDLYNGRTRIAFYVGQVPAEGLNKVVAQNLDACLIWRQAHAAAYGGS